MYVIYTLEVTLKFLLGEPTSISNTIQACYGHLAHTSLLSAL